MDYSKKFNEAVAVVLDHEGGYNNIKEDKGGATKFGISLRFLQQHNINIDDKPVIDWMDVNKLTKDQAIEIYHTHFWQHVYDRMPPRLSNKVFNIAVNAGHSRAHKLLQQAVNNFTGNTLAVDGAIGEKTLHAINRVDEVVLLHKLAMEQATFYARLVVKDHSQIVFLMGWINRANYIPQ